jgi:hypothetical protein
LHLGQQLEIPLHFDQQLAFSLHAVRVAANNSRILCKGRLQAPAGRRVLRWCETLPFRHR